MKTIRPIPYHAAPYGLIAVIPAGATVTPASNLPATDPPRYWVKAWRGMTIAARSWSRNYGFLLSLDEIH